MSDTQNFQYMADEELPRASSASIGELVNSTLAFLRRQYVVILGCVAAGLLSAAIYLIFMPRNYIATDLILFDRTNRPVMSQQPMFSDSPFDAGFFESQIRIIRSEALALQVVKRLNLRNDPHFLDTGVVYLSL